MANCLWYKTIIALQICTTWIYPRAFLEQFKSKVIIDEVQYVPGLFSYIQANIDENKKPAKFVLTGSSQLSLIEGVSQSLAGRSAILQLLPLAQEEIHLKRTKFTTEEMIFSGGYPSIHFDKQPIIDWYGDYCRNYLERDVRTILNIKDLGTFQLFLKMCAARCGQIINYSSFANDCGISPNTAKEWMNILEASFIIYRLHPFYKNYSKRLVKSPKLYFYDTGVACSLLGITSSAQLITHSLRGGLFESWVISEFKKKYFNDHKEPPVYFWRDNKGKEIDLVVEKLEKFDAVEIKSAKTINFSFFDNLNYLESISQNEISKKILIYGGHQNQKRSNSLVFSWKSICEIK
ncbi:MAG: ATP-binding protein [bacterium]